MHRRKINTRRVVLIFIAAIAAGFAVIVGIAISASSAASSASDPTTPVSFSGAWSAKAGSTTMNAIITDDGIEIYFVDGDSSALYWEGTFPVPVNVSPGATYSVVSQGNLPEMEGSVMGSQDKTKTFTYKDGKLSFEFTAVGVTTTVHLSR